MDTGQHQVQDLLLSLLQGVCCKLKGGHLQEEGVSLLRGSCFTNIAKLTCHLLPYHFNSWPIRILDMLISDHGF